MLAPGGRFLFDVHALPYLASRTEGIRTAKHPRGGFRSAGPHTERVETLVYREQRATLDRYTITEPGRTWTVWNWLQAYDPASLEQTLAREGLTVGAVLGAVTGQPYDPAAQELAVTCRKASPR